MRPENKQRRCLRALLLLLRLLRLPLLILLPLLVLRIRWVGRPLTNLCREAVLERQRRLHKVIYTTH